MGHEGIEEPVSELEEWVWSARSGNKGVRVGRLIGFTNVAVPLVVFAGPSGDMTALARSTVDLRGEHVGRDVVLAFEPGDPRSPIIVGCLIAADGSPLPERSGQVEVDADGERVVVTAKQEIVLRCGEASITLTREGRIAIRGTYVVTHAKGVNRIRGGSVQIN